MDTLDQERFDRQQKLSEQTITQMNQKLAQADQKNIALEKQSQKIISENENLKSELHKLNVQHELTMTHLNDAKSELIKTTQKLDQFDALQIKFDAQNNIVIGLQTQHALTQQQLENEKLKSKEISEQNKALASEKWILGQEKAQLYGQLKQFNVAFENNIIQQ